MRSLVVEFCGLPGSGKSTAAEHTRIALETRGVPCNIADLDFSAAVSRRRRILRRTLASSRESLRHPLETIESAGVISASGQHAHRDTAAVLAQWLALRDLLERVRRRPGVHLVEEGMLQTVWTMLLRAESDPTDQLWQLVPARSRPDLVLVLDVPVALAERRLTERPSRHSRTQLLPQEQLALELRHGAHLMERIVDDAPMLKRRLATGGLAGPAAVGERAADLIQRSAPELP